jgi:hypothetical protein
VKKQGSGIRDQGSEKQRVPHVARIWGRGIVPTPGAPPLRGFFAQGWDSTNLIGAAIILLAAAVATAPLILCGFSCGHDFDFHLVSWMDCLDAWHRGVLYPHWTPSANYGAGEPRFVFYPPLTWMLGAALGAVFGWQAAPVLLTFLLLAATGLATWALARKFLSNSAATLAGCLAIFSGYAPFCVYERSAYGELAGGCTIPLILLFALKTSRTNTMDCHPERSTLGAPRSGVSGAKDLRLSFRSLRFSVPLSLSFAIAASWLANAPVGVMACYLLAGFALALAIARRSWQPLLRAALGVALGLGLAAFYLIPAAVEQKWVDIHEATDDPGLKIETSFLFARHSNPLLALHDAELEKVSWIAVLMFAAAFAALALCLLRRRLPGERKLWLPLALIPLAILVLQFPVSLPLWNLLPKLRFLQFPWRWLVALEAPLGIFLAAAIWPHGRKSRIAVAVLCAAAFVAIAAFEGTHFQQPCDDEDAISGMTAAYAANQGFAGTDEYAPPGADNTLVASGLPAACLVSDPTAELGAPDPDNPPPDGPPVWSPQQQSCDSFRSVATGSVEHRRIRGVAPHAGFLILRLRRYPAWSLRLNGQPVAQLPTRDDGLTAVPVPAGFLDLTADWTTTPDVAAGRWISLAVLVIVLVAAILPAALKRRRAQ